MFPPMRESKDERQPRNRTPSAFWHVRRDMQERTTPVVVRIDLFSDAVSSLLILSFVQKI